MVELKLVYECSNCKGRFRIDTDSNREGIQSEKDSTSGNLLEITVEEQVLNLMSSMTRPTPAYIRVLFHDCLRADRERASKHVQKGLPGFVLTEFKQKYGEAHYVGVEEE